MHIGIVASNLIRVPPQPEDIPPGFSGAPETIIWTLTENLIKRGHKVALFASGDSQSSATLYSVSPRASSLDPLIGLNRHIDYEYWLISLALDYANKNGFDLIHSHIPRRTAVFAKYFPCPIVATLHSPASQDRLLTNHASDQSYVSISDTQGKMFKKFNNIQCVQTVYHGINSDLFTYVSTPRDDLIFVGRIVPQKGLEVALEVAHKIGLSLHVFGEVPQESRVYYERSILRHKKKSDYFHGFMSQERVVKATGNSKVLLTPVQWDEPFGLVMIEAMACGTPVVAFRRGSVPEVIKDGETGFIVEPGDIEGMVRAVKRIYEMPKREYLAMRRRCREHVEKNFTVEKMVDGYERVYQRVIAEHKNIKTKKHKN